MKTAKQSFLNNPNTLCPQLQQIIDRYGQDALHPKILTIEAEDSIDFELVPKMRFDMACEDWYALCPDLRLFVLKSFYESL